MTTPDAPIRKRWADPFVPPHRARKGNRKIICHHSRRFRSSRERWWFVAVSNCNGTRGIDIKYKILMVNGPSDDYWHHHFSADEFCMNLRFHTSSYKMNYPCRYSAGLDDFNDCLLVLVAGDNYLFCRAQISTAPPLELQALRVFRPLGILRNPIPGDGLPEICNKRPRFSSRENAR